MAAKAMEYMAISASLEYRLRRKNSERRQTTSVSTMPRDAPAAKRSTRRGRSPAGPRTGASVCSARRASAVVTVTWTRAMAASTTNIPVMPHPASSMATVATVPPKPVSSPRTVIGRHRCMPINTAEGRVCRMPMAEAAAASTHAAWWSLLR
jgi:hypothetical protein